MHLITYRPHQEGSGCVGQLGNDTDQLAVKVIRWMVAVLPSGMASVTVAPSPWPSRAVIAV